MKSSRFPEGWNERRVSKLLDHYETQSEEEGVAEDEALWFDPGQTVKEIDANYEALQEALPDLRQKKMWSRLLVGLSMAGGFCGFAALLWIFHLIPVETIVPVNKIEHIYEKLSLHIWFLEMILLVVGLAAAVLGFVGYQSIKEEAIKQAVEKAGQEAIEYLELERVKFELERVKLDESDAKLKSIDHKVQPDSPEKEVR